MNRITHEQLELDLQTSPSVDKAQVDRSSTLVTTSATARVFSFSDRLAIRRSAAEKSKRESDAVLLKRMVDRVRYF